MWKPESTSVEEIEIEKIPTKPELFRIMIDRIVGITKDYNY